MALSEECKRELKYWERLEECRKVIRGYSSLLMKLEVPDGKMKEMYAFIKETIPEFYIDDVVPHMHSSYDFIRRDIIATECLFEDRFIGDSAPIFSFFDNKEIDECCDPDRVLDYIVYSVRRYLVLSHSLNSRRPIDINRLHFENDCLKASNKVKELCDQLYLESRIIGIYPGYLEDNDFYNGNGFHMCNVVRIGDKDYLIDCTYRQFFTMRQNFLDRLGVVNLAGCKAGRFMLMNEDRKSVATKVLKDGWIQLEGDVLKHYLDGFTMSFRNGLYYEQTGDFSYTTDYDVDTYIKFLRGEDNQLNHEDREVLGYQKRPLRNPKLPF